MTKREQQQGGIVFLDAPRGTGKTYLINILLAEIQSRSEVALAVASSGIAATFMDSGRGLPIELSNYP